MNPVIAPPDGVAGTPVFTDGFGTRFLGLDAESGDPVEILAFDPSLVSAPGFGSTAGVRVARVSAARHTLFARVRRIERPTPDSLLLVSDRVSGWRLADVLDTVARERLALDTSAVLNLLRQLIPAVALFGRHQRDLTVGTIAPERLILTPAGRLVLAEYVFGEAIDRLSMEPHELWRRFRIADSAVTANPHDGARSDVLAIGIVALSLLLGRCLREEEFPDALRDLLELASESHGGESRPLSPGLASWLARMLQLPGHKALASPKEAQVAFEELLANESGYVTSPALLDAFINRFQHVAGPPPELREEEPPAAMPVAAAIVVNPPPDIPAQPDRTPLESALSPRPEDGWAPTPQPSYWEPIVSEPVTLAPPPMPDPVPEPEPPIGRTEFVDRTAEPAVPRDLPAIHDAAAEYEAPGFAGETAVPYSTEPDSGIDAVAPAKVHPVEAAPVEPIDPDAIVTSSLTGTPAASSATAEWMTRAVAALTFVIVLETAALGWLWNRSSAALLREGELSIQSRPEAARVTVDDDEVGVTPVSVRLAPGTYSVKVQAGNSEPRVLVVQIKPGVQTAQYLELQTGR